MDSARIGSNATRISLVASITSEDTRDSVNDFARRTEYKPHYPAKCAEGPVGYCLKRRPRSPKTGLARPEQGLHSPEYEPLLAGHPQECTTTMYWHLC